MNTPSDEQLKAKIDQAKRMVRASGDQMTTDRLRALVRELEQQQQQQQ